MAPVLPLPRGAERCDVIDRKVAGRRADALTPEAYQEFERFFLDWVDRYSEELQLGGLGNPKELAMFAFAWAGKMGASQPLNFSELMDAHEIESQDHQEESDTDRLSRLHSETVRQATLLSAIRTYRVP